MKITIYSALKKRPTLYADALTEYVKRISPFATLKIIYRDKKSKPPVIKKDSFVISVSSGQPSISSPGLALAIGNAAVSGYSELIIIMKHTDETVHPDLRISLSGFEFSDELSDVVLAEQLYRAFCINNNITYHK